MIYLYAQGNFLKLNFQLDDLRAISARDDKNWAIEASFSSAHEGESCLFAISPQRCLIYYLLVSLDGEKAEFLHRMFPEPAFECFGLS